MIHIVPGGVRTEAHADHDGNNTVYVTTTAGRAPKPRVAVRSTADGAVTLTVDGCPFDALTGMRVQGLSLKATPDGVKMVLECVTDTVEVDVEGGLRGLTRAPKADADPGWGEWPPADGRPALFDFAEESRRVREDQRVEAEFQAHAKAQIGELSVGQEAAKAAFDTICAGMGVPPGLYSPPRPAQEVVQGLKATTLKLGGYELETTEFVCADALSIAPPDGHFVRPGPHALPEVPGIGLTADEKRDLDAAAADGWRCVMPARYPIVGDDGKQVGWSDGAPFVPVDFGTGDSGDETDPPVVVTGR